MSGAGEGRGEGGHKGRKFLFVKLLKIHFSWTFIIDPLRICFCDAVCCIWTNLIVVFYLKEHCETGAFLTKMRRSFQSVVKLSCVAILW